ncbi:unnamed protein product [Clavelina lepadiformis]|uniref:Enoyl-CoA hydratase n=1 Tax=Clavelina lepadiformis TaxID=159417 RepID=A0ABP0FAS6_CLALP
MNMIKLANFLRVYVRFTIAVIVLCISDDLFSYGEGESGLTYRISHAYPIIKKVIHALESCRKPVVAALLENAKGEHLEIALSCHYRTALKTTKFGLPQVKHGLIPGLGGNEFSTEMAISIGLVDEVFSSSAEAVDRAVAFAHNLAGTFPEHRILRNCFMKDAAKGEQLMTKYMSALSTKNEKAWSVYMCLQTTYAASFLSFEEGLKKESEALQFLISSAQFRALQYVNESEILASRWKFSDKFNYQTVEPVQVRKAAVIGLGTMGSGIAIAVARIGIPVYVMEFNEAVLKERAELIYSTIRRMSLRKEITETMCNSMISGIVPISDYSMLKDVDLVIEAVFELISLKKEVFSNLNAVCKSTAILASNTSQLDIDDIASVARDPGKVVGMHFFAPSHRMKLLENVYGTYTSYQTISTAMHIGSLMGKVSVLVGNCHGFVGNRMYLHYMTESDFLLEEGAYPEQIDTTLKEFGFTKGRFEVADLSGNDVIYTVRNGTHPQKKHGKRHRERVRNGIRYCPLADILVESGRYGHKTDGKGWFKYVDRVPYVDENITQMIKSYRESHDITPRTIHFEEVLHRMLYCMINEGFKILEEGMASSPNDIDMVWLHGYGWPKSTGGPMYYAFTVETKKQMVASECKKFKFCHTWQPSVQNAILMLSALTKDATALPTLIHLFSE